MSVEHIEEGGLEIDQGLVANEVCFLTDGEVLIFPCETARG